MTLNDDQRGALLMNVAMLVFPLSDAFTKAALQTLPLFQTIALRGALAVAGLLLVARLSGAVRLWPAAPRDRGILAVRTLAEVAGALLFLAALRHMALGNIAAILQALPLAVTLAAALVFGERIGWRRLSAIGIGFAGVLLILRPGGEGFDRWSALAVASVCAIVVRDLASRRLGPSVPSIAVGIWAAGAVMLSGFIGSALGGWQPVGAMELAYLAGSAANLVVGYVAVVSALRVGDIGFVAPFRYMSLVWAIVLGWAVFGTWPDAPTFAGAGIVVATGLFTLWREHRMSQARNRG